MLEINLQNPDVVRIAARVKRGEINHRIMSDIVTRASWYRLSDKQINLLCSIEAEFDDPSRRKQTPKPVSVGSLSALVELLKTAGKHLKWPSFRIAIDAEDEVVISRAKGKNAGWLYVKSPGGYNNNTYYGKVNEAGEFLGSRASSPAIEQALVRFSADPAGVASEYGRLHGKCCFCNLPLKDERSTTVGYGKTCSKHYGLPWGAK